MKNKALQNSLALPSPAHAPIRLLVLARLPRYRNSLAALLATLPGAEIQSESTLPVRLGNPTSAAPDLLLVSGSLTASNLPNLGSTRRSTPTTSSYSSVGGPTGLDLVRKARSNWPDVKIAFLVEPSQFTPGARLNGVDLVLPMDTPAGGLLQSIERLLQGSTARTKYSPFVLSLAH